LADESRSFQTIEGRHADVHNDDIGLQLPRLFNRIVPVRRFATHIVAGLAEKGSHATADNLMVIDN
jgi:hypothetical protein